ncbi:MAG: hypothetical protein AMS27_00815 [Bacteroides sp. SM23_62_1]|nr:MAG: hypothetical protein AMS27_00815 [Bacteroides sp. SM23_62_1]
MKRIILKIVVIAAVAFVPFTLNAQCKGFAKKICKVELTPYIHDGNYHAAMLTIGEEAELYKTFYSDTDYRISVCGSDELPDIEFRVIDSDRNVLYTNKSNDYSRIWDFRLEASQQLKIFILVPATEGLPEDILGGCVAIMFGFKEK